MVLIILAGYYQISGLLVFLHLRKGYSMAVVKAKTVLEAYPPMTKSFAKRLRVQKIRKKAGRYTTPHIVYMYVIYVYVTVGPKC
jgi:hypothetical protein